MKHVIDGNLLIRIYFAFIRPILEYADIVWDNCTQEITEFFEKVQVDAARIVTGLRVNSSNVFV